MNTLTSKILVNTICGNTLVEIYSANKILVKLKQNFHDIYILLKKGLEIKFPRFFSTELLTLIQ